MDQQQTVVLSLLAAVFYGGSELCIKLGTTALEGHQVQLIKTFVSTFSYMIVALLFTGAASTAAGSNKGGFLPSTTKYNSYSYYIVPVLFCVGSGLCSFLAGSWKTKAIKDGGALCTVSALTACYPAFSFLMSVLWLGEDLKWNKVLGLIFALCSALAFSHDPSSSSSTSDSTSGVVSVVGGALLKNKTE